MMQYPRSTWSSAAVVPAPARVANPWPRTARLTRTGTFAAAGYLHHRRLDELVDGYRRLSDTARALLPAGIAGSLWLSVFVVSKTLLAL